MSRLGELTPEQQGDLADAVITAMGNMGQSAVVRVFPAGAESADGACVITVSWTQAAPASPGPIFTGPAEGRLP
jgi:hypothetical protein